MDFADLTDAELISLIDNARAELDSRKKLIHIEMTTNSSFDSRKHGHAYVAILSIYNGKTERTFISGDYRQWDSKRKYYKQSFSCDLKVGTVLECRLNNGSWKNDYREWYKVTQEGIESITQEEAHLIIKNALAKGGL